MKKTSLKTTAVILAVGLILCLGAYFLTCIVKTPTITEHDFPYSVTYQLDGETKTFEGVYRCRFEGHREGMDPWDRYYTEEYIVEGEETLSHTYTIAEKDGMELFVVTVFNECYLMGDTKDMDYEPSLEDPHLEAVDAEGYGYDADELPDIFDAKIVSWEYPQPVENTFVFSGFSFMYYGTMLAMLAIGLLVILACLVFVKRDKSRSLKVLDILSVIVNFAAVLAAIPFITVVVGLMPLVAESESFTYQMFLCIPAFTAFTVGASIVLRRNGFTKTGFFLPFVGPAVFALFVILDSFITLP